MSAQKKSKTTLKAKKGIKKVKKSSKKLSALIKKNLKDHEKSARYLIDGALILLLLLFFFVLVDDKQEPAVYLPEPPLKEIVRTSTTSSIIPEKILIPSIGVAAKVEHVGRARSGNMAVPRDFDNVGWFREGYIPGEKGGAVIAGHLDDARGNEAVFYNLDSLEEGDRILVRGENETLEFVVTQKKVYPYNTQDTREIFGEMDEAHLNLITCDGAWDQGKRTYENRLVVFAELVKD